MVLEIVESDCDPGELKLVAHLQMGRFYDINMVLIVVGALPRNIL